MQPVEDREPFAIPRPRFPVHHGRKADAAGKRLLPPPQRLVQSVGIPRQEALGRFAERQVDQRRMFAADVEEVRDHAQRSSPESKGPGCCPDC